MNSKSLYPLKQVILCVSNELVVDCVGWGGGEAIFSPNQLKLIFGSTVFPRRI